MADGSTSCVLLAPPEQRHDAFGELTRRGWVAHEASHPLPAMAELCLLDRLAGIDGGKDGRRADDLALVVVEPAHWPQLPALVAAARRYVPQAALWSYREGVLAPIAAEGGPPPAASNARRPASYEPPQGRAAGPREDAGDAGPSRISADEIDMLLDEGHGDDDT